MTRERKEGDRKKKPSPNLLQAKEIPALTLTKVRGNHCCKSCKHLCASATTTIPKLWLCCLTISAAVSLWNHILLYEQVPRRKYSCTLWKNRLKYQISLTTTIVVRQIWATSWENLFMPYMNNKGADQPAHPHNLIGAFVVCCLDSIIHLLAIAEIPVP